MTDTLSEAEQFLLEGIVRGDSMAWEQFVDRYQGRLHAFALRLCGRTADAEDLVQETFVGLITSLANFRRDCSLETLAFTILRRRSIDLLRRRSAGGAASVKQTAGPAGLAGVAGREPTASHHLRLDESRAAHAQALDAAIDGWVARLQAGKRLGDLQLADALFSAGMANRNAAACLGLDEKQVALKKHRWIKSLRSAMATGQGPESTLFEDPGGVDGMLCEAWLRRRPTCPARSTLGRYVLGTLDGDWQAYVGFHAERIDCRFCAANLADLRKGAKAASRMELHRRVMDSTLGFFPPAAPGTQ